MKGSLLLAILLCCATWVFAQSENQDNSNGQTGNASPSSNQTDSQAGSSNSNSQSDIKLRGCLRQGNGTYEVTDLETGTTYSLFGQSDLAQHVGHDVEVMGAPTGTSGHEATSPQENSKTGKSAQDNPFQVHSVRDVGECQTSNQKQ